MRTNKSTQKVIIVTAMIIIHSNATGFVLSRNGIVNSNHLKNIMIKKQNFELTFVA